MRSRRRIGASAGNVRAGRPLAAVWISVNPPSRSRRRWTLPRQSLKSPATTSGAPPGTSLATSPSSTRELCQPVRFPQREVHADRVQWRESARQLDDGVQESPRFRIANGGVDVSPGGNRVLRQQGIAVMSAGGDGIPSIRMLRPHAVRENLVLFDRQTPDLPRRPISWRNTRSAPDARRASRVRSKVSCRCPARKPCRAFRVSTRIQEPSM